MRAEPARAVSPRSTPLPASPTSGSTSSWPSDLTTGTPGREVDEFMEVAMLRWSEVGRMIRRGEMKDAKTLSGLMFVQCFRRVR